MYSRVLKCREEHDAGRSGKRTTRKHQEQEASSSKTLLMLLYKLWTIASMLRSDNIKKMILGTWEETVKVILIHPPPPRFSSGRGRKSPGKFWRTLGVSSLVTEHLSRLLMEPPVQWSSVLCDDWHGLYDVAERLSNVSTMTRERDIFLVISFSLVLISVSTLVRILYFADCFCKYNLRMSAFSFITIYLVFLFYFYSIIISLIARSNKWSSLHNSRHV